MVYTAASGQTEALSQLAYLMLVTASSCLCTLTNATSQMLTNSTDQVLAAIHAIFFPKIAWDRWTDSLETLAAPPLAQVLLILFGSFQLIRALFLEGPDRPFRRYLDVATWVSCFLSVGLSAFLFQTGILLVFFALTLAVKLLIIGRKT